jgi:hypothetical protein
MAAALPHVTEKAVPPSFERPGRLRLLDAFRACGARGELLSLDVLELNPASSRDRATLRVEGVLVEPDESMDPKQGAWPDLRR